MLTGSTTPIAAAMHPLLRETVPELCRHHFQLLPVVLRLVATHGPQMLFQALWHKQLATRLVVLLFRDLDHTASATLMSSQIHLLLPIHGACPSAGRVVISAMVVIP